MLKWFRKREYKMKAVLAYAAICADCSNLQIQNLSGFPLGAHLSELSAPAAGWDAYPELGEVRFSRFDPTFRASFWNDKTGFINAPDAPWNQSGSWSPGYPLTQKEFFDRAKILTTPFLGPSSASLASRMI